MHTNIQTIVAVKCLDQVLQLINAPRIASGGVNAVRAEFEFCPLWDSLVKTAVFYTDPKVVYHRVLVDDACDVPQEVLAAPGLMYMGVFGVDSEGSIVRPSVTLVLTVEEGAITEATAVSDPTPELYAQVLAEVQKAREAAERANGVGIDLTGAPLEYVALPEDVGSVSEEWVELADITTTEAVQIFFVNADKDGNPFSCKKLQAEITWGADRVHSGVWWGLQRGQYGFGDNMSKTQKRLIIRLEMAPGCFVTSTHSVQAKDNFWQDEAGGLMCAPALGTEFTALQGFSLFLGDAGNAEHVVPANTRVRLWGVKA